MSESVIFDIDSLFVYLQATDGMGLLNDSNECYTSDYPEIDYYDTSLDMNGTAAEGIIIGDRFHFLYPFTWDIGYGNTQTDLLCASLPTDVWEAFRTATSGGGGLDCEALRTCIWENPDEPPMLVEEIPTDTEGFRVWSYAPVEEPNPILEEQIEVPIRRMSDIIAVLQMMSYQIQDLKLAIGEGLVGAAFPEYQQIRIENNRPVGIFQMCELKPDGKLTGAHYTCQIPYLQNIPEIFPAQLLWFQSGNKQCLRLFPDNSRIILYALDETEGQRILDIFTALMEPDKSVNFIVKFTDISPPKFETRWKIPKYLSYWGQGDKRARPDWSQLVLDYSSFSYPPGFNPVP